MRKMPIIVIAVLTSLPAAAIAGSIAGNGGATEVTQMLNNVESMMQTGTQIQRVQQGIQQVNQMMRDAQRFASDPLGLGEIVGVYNNVVGEVRAMQNLAYGTVRIAEGFKNIHPDFNPSRTYNPQDYVRRTKATMQSIENAFVSGASTVARAETDQARIVELGKKVNTAEGTTQVLVTANAIQYEVLQQLRNTQMYQKTVNDAQLSYIASQESNKAASEIQKRDLYANVKDLPPPTGRRYK